MRISGGGFAGHPTLAPPGCRPPVRRQIDESASVTLEELDGPFVLLGRGAGGEGTEVAPPTGARVGLAGIQAVLPAGKLADHYLTSGWEVWQASCSPRCRRMSHLFKPPRAAQPPARSRAGPRPATIAQGAARCAAAPGLS